MNELKQELLNLLKMPEKRFADTILSNLSLSLDEAEFPKIITSLSSANFVLSCIFAMETKGIKLFYVFEKSGYKDFLILDIHLFKGKIPSIAQMFPIACLYEREIRDGFGVDFEGSTDDRRLFLHECYPLNFHPLNKSFKGGAVKMKEPSPDGEYKFKEVHGEGVYHIPVGPVHAGIIEPGHFRFSAIGETIFNLEIRMFWKHRGIEKSAEGKTPLQALPVAQAISGDETIANSWAFCLAAEKIAGTEIPIRAEHLRLIFAEMERIYSLLGDLAGMIIDVAYPVGASPFFVLREEILRWNEKLCGSRFFKNAIVLGGVNNEVSKQTLLELSHYLASFNQRFQNAVHNALSQPSVIDRFETTGIVKKELIKPLNLTGPIARASGIDVDVRKDHPYGLYKKIVPSIKVSENGDVQSRFMVKTETIINSAHLIKNAINEILEGKIKVEYKVKDGSCLSAVESCRGQNMHWISIKHGLVQRYKARTASFCNWQAIEHAVLGNIVPDFPLINKSMNLSYAGTDL